MKRTITVCDKCKAEVGTDGGVMRFNFYDGRRGAKQAELCGPCAEKLAGRPVPRRGRPRKEEVAAP